MAYNLVISFEIRNSLRQGALIAGAIEELGSAAKILGTTWYVRSELTASEAARRVGDVMDPADSLLVLNVSDNDAAMLNVEERCVRFMERSWHQGPEEHIALPLVITPYLNEQLRVQA